eukprot:COSAG01_NODE_4584_length_4898_cov_18.985622_8_plen_98_part_00
MTGEQDCRGKLSGLRRSGCQLGNRRSHVQVRGCLEQGGIVRAPRHSQRRMDFSPCVRSMAGIVAGEVGRLPNGKSVVGFAIGWMSSFGALIAVYAGT